MPNPRKERAASTRMAWPTCKVAWTMRGAMVLGTRWRNMMRKSVAPRAWAAVA